MIFSDYFPTTKRWKSARRVTHKVTSCDSSWIFKNKYKLWNSKQKRPRLLIARRVIKKSFY